MIFGIKEKCIILTHTMLAIATNIPQRPKTAFVLQGHVCPHNTFYSLGPGFKTRGQLLPAGLGRHYARRAEL